jgi:alpha-glucoside transport system permease protein
VRRVVAALTVLVAVAASRTFDLVMVMAPGSVQDQAEVLALYLLRQPDIEGAGHADAVGVLWLVLASAVAVVVAMLTSGRRSDWPLPSGRAHRRRLPAPRVRQRDQSSTGRIGRFWNPVHMRQVTTRVALTLVVGVWALPLVLLLVTSLHSPVDQVRNGWRASLSMGSYAEVVPGDLGAALLPTAVMALLVTVVVLVSGTLAGYALAWLDPPGRKIATIILVIAAVVPIQAVARPLHEALFALGIDNQAAILTIVHIGRGVPLAALVLRNSFATLPREQFHRTRWGSGSLAQALARITVLEARPALIAVLALEFVFVWNDLVVGFLFGGAGFSPVGMVLFGQSRQFVTGASVLAAGSVLASLVPIVVVLVARRSIIDGLAPRATR